MSVSLPLLESSGRPKLLTSIRTTAGRTFSTTSSNAPSYRRKTSVADAGTEEAVPVIPRGTIGVCCASTIATHATSSGASVIDNARFLLIIATLPAQFWYRQWPRAGHEVGVIGRNIHGHPCMQKKLS